MIIADDSQAAAEIPSPLKNNLAFWTGSAESQEEHFINSKTNAQLEVEARTETDTDTDLQNSNRTLETKQSEQVTESATTEHKNQKSDLEKL